MFNGITSIHGLTMYIHDMYVHTQCVITVHTCAYRVRPAPGGGNVVYSTMHTYIL